MIAVPIRLAVPTLGTLIIGVAVARLWIHGHIYDWQDYRIGSTRFIENPHGYLSFGTTAFRQQVFSRPISSVSVFDHFGSHEFHGRIAARGVELGPDTG